MVDNHSCRFGFGVDDITNFVVTRLQRFAPATLDVSLISCVNRRAGVVASFGQRGRLIFSPY